MVRQRVVLFPGAGFSKPAGGPLLRELLSEPFLSQSQARPAALATLIWLQQSPIPPAIERPSMEDVFTHVWREARTGGEIEANGTTWDAEELLKEATIHLASLSSAVHMRRSRNLWKLYRDYFATLASESETLVVVTTNYDSLVEQCLDDADLRFDCGDVTDLEFVDSARRKALSRSGSDVSLLKLHGSANWGVCRACRKAEVLDDVVNIFESAYVPRRRTSCSFCDDHYLESGIIPPISGKAGEIRFVQPLWSRARGALRKADRVVIVGYSLPATDLETQSLLRDARGLLRNATVTLVCGTGGASTTLTATFPKAEDVRQNFEDYIETLN